MWIKGQISNITDIDDLQTAFTSSHISNRAEGERISDEYPDVLIDDISFEMEGLLTSSSAYCCCHRQKSSISHHQVKCDTPTTRSIDRREEGRNMQYASVDSRFETALDTKT